MAAIRLWWCEKLKAWFDKKTNMACVMCPGKCGYHASSDTSQWEDCTAEPGCWNPLTSITIEPCGKCGGRGWTQEPAKFMPSGEPIPDECIQVPCEACGGCAAYSGTGKVAVIPATPEVLALGKEK